ncbi:hypothetical protein [Bosea psychrotolerans]|uniref:Phasin protein n=1 Tax=Bosea psychrotolerans TaxID=1871628 RepID=A0A2S4M4H1_9HYPH|nr:hypothetical protein [Bosea psychrotolerans]POR49613.1 hypothetical protein CYD53_111106 [Bosea psychrotolerans]
MDDTERLKICQQALGMILIEHDKALERLRRETSLYESARFSQSADAAAIATRALFQTSALSAQNALMRMHTARLAVTTAQAIMKADEVEACLLDSGYQCRSRPPARSSL